MNFEYIIIKNLLSDPYYFKKAKTILNPEIFTDPDLGRIYKSILKFDELYNKAPNFQDLTTSINDIPNKDTRLNIAKKLIEIKNSENVSKEALDDKTVKYVQDSMFTNALLRGSDFIDLKDQNAKEDARKLIEESLKISLDVDLGMNYQDIERRIEYYQTPKPGIKYLRYKSLNRRLGGGFLKGTLNLFLAPAGVGKSLLMSTSITDFIMQGYNVLLVSMEMSDYEFVKRVDADLLDIQISSFRDCSKEAILNNFNNIKDKIGKFYTKVYPAGTFSANMLDSLLDTYRDNGIEFDVVFLDYLGIMKSDRVSPNVGLYSYVKSIGEEVRGLAVKRDLTVISASQLNRQATNNTEASNDSVSDSLGTVQTADFLCFLLQTEQMKAENKLKFKITKNRYTGITDSFDLLVNYQNMRVIDEFENPDELLTIDQKRDIYNEVTPVDTPKMIESKSNLDDFMSFFDDKKDDVPFDVDDKVESQVSKVKTENKVTDNFWEAMGVDDPTK